jgi:prepilin signal peptidase PulO-like enzyme (type II secretory pathway)
MNITLIFPILLGTITGYLINYLADVLPIDIKLSRPLCKNADCQKSQNWKDYFLLRRCAQCGKLPSLRVYLVFVATVCFSVYIWQSPPAYMGFWVGYLVFVYLFLVALIDLETRLVLRPLSLIGLVLFLVVGLYVRTWQETLLGAAAGFGIMMFFYLLGMLFSRLRNKRLGTAADGEEALGSGDVTLATLLGLLLGWPLIWFNLLTGILLAGAFSLLLILGLVITKKYRSMMVFIAYGPFFIISALFLIYFPNWITAVLPAG